MRKLLTFLTIFGAGFVLLTIGSNFSSCTKRTTQILTDTVVKNDTLIKTVKDTLTLIDTVPAINLKQGLIAYYPFNGNAVDSSGNNNNGTVYGGLTYTSDKNNNANSAALFDGTSSYILVNDNGSLSPNSITIAAQFYCTYNQHQNMISKIQFANAEGAVGGISPFGGGSSYPGDMGFAIRGPGVDCNTVEGIQVADVAWAMENIQVNTWYQITCTFDQGKEKTFINGVLRNAITRDFLIPKQCTQSQLVFGAWWSGDPLFYHGKLDEVRIYNRALNYREIQQLAAGYY